jgi:hypothetical protein
MMAKLNMYNIIDGLESCKVVAHHAKEALEIAQIEENDVLYVNILALNSIITINEDDGQKTTKTVEAWLKEFDQPECFCQSVW